MKKTLFYFISLFFILSLLSGCKTNCGYPTECWKGWFNESRCGTYTISPCQKICDACTFNEPVCQECLMCMNMDGCGYGRVKMCEVTKIPPQCPFNACNACNIRANSYIYHN